MRLKKISKSLQDMLKKNFSNKLPIFEGDRGSTSGVRATIFGATGYSI